MISAKDIIKDFKEKKWKSNPFERMIELQKTNPKEIYTLLSLALNEIPEGGTFIDAALSYLHEKEFNELIISSIETLRNNRKSEIANSIVAYATLQMPHLLKPFLNEFLSIKPNDGTYYESWVWREGEKKEIDILKNILLNEESDTLKQQAWDNLVNKGYERYLFEKNKIELKRVRVNVPNPKKAKLKLKQLTYQRWTWMVLPNNCVHYVEEILQAGGCNFNLKSNCPKIGR